MHLVVSSLGKAFRHYPSVGHRFLDYMLPGTRFASPAHTWVLKDVSFAVPKGEALGIIGVNGAGKSTLLKIVAGTMRPTTGYVEVNGSISALLELGMGFHLEFTGRQNAIMAAQLQGCTARDIKKILPIVEDFAELGDYFDRPLRTYSSGMQMRLAFSVATARRPDILVVDEALSVGDAYFQHKSFDRIREFRVEGTTLIIVSHSPSAIQAICSSAILLENGVVARQGNPEDVLDYYNATLADQARALVTMEKLKCGAIRTVSGTKDVRLESVCMTDEKGRRLEVVETGQRVKLKVQAKVFSDVPSLVLGFLIKDTVGQAIYGINTFRLGKTIYDVTAGTEVDFVFDFPLNLGKGNYSISLSFSRWDSHLEGNYEWTDRALIFHVVNSRHEDFVGCSWLGARVDVSPRPAVMCDGLMEPSRYDSSGI